MAKKDTQDALASVIAVFFDAIAVFGGFMLATWIRFDSGWVPIFFGSSEPANVYALYIRGALFGTLIYLLVFRALKLYVRPQLGRFENKIPRLVRAIGIALVLAVVANALLQNYYTKIATVTFALSFVTIAVLVVLERYLLFRIELHYARHSPQTNHVLILGTDEVAAHLRRALRKEPQLRSEVIGFLRTDISEPDAAISADMIKGTVSELGSFVENNPIDQLILTNSSLGHEKIVELIIFCEQNMIRFNMVPDLFRILTASMDVQSVDDIPMLGVGGWPLDVFWNRAVKRLADVIGALCGLVLCSPVLLVASILTKKESSGPVFFSQERCGEKGKSFNLYKLRTMSVDAESETGPVFTAEDDPRVTRTGSFFRRHNIDELPQLWNVLKGDMSLVGPRPERPHFVEQFKADIGRYMSRHVSKPGMTGWAQVNGLRGNTSIEERIKYDLYYLENWSMAFDFKVLVKTVVARENAY
jgi:exopolysaccharide biosynthesis polyprenyl glycosylphosphotransferase